KRDRRRYAELQAKLTSLNTRRSEVQQRLTRYRHLQRLLEPFKNPQENVQPNLVTRDGELGKELDRMRILMARVAGRIEGLDGQGRRTPGDEVEEEQSEQQKLEQILGRR
ncbi:MAG: hypothetical protein M1837_003548, partial [Sclerophora amabilis]